MDNSVIAVWRIAYESGLIRAAVLRLLLDGTLDKEKASDFSYVIKIVRDNIEKAIKEIPVFVTSHGSFMKTARAALRARNKEAAIVLLATAVEQQINLFYREALGFREDFTGREVTEIIRNTNLSMKIGGLFKLVSGNQCNDSLQKRTLDLIEVRNQIVHYKAVPALNIDDHETGSHAHIKRHIQALDMKDLFAIPEDLSNLFEQAIEAMQKKKYADFDEQAELATKIVKLVNQGIEKPLRRKNRRKKKAITTRTRRAPTLVPS